MSETIHTNTELKQPIPTNYGALSTLIIVFFFWGFIAAGNSVFIPFCKDYFSLDQFQSMLIDFAFYTAYYFGALLLFAFGSMGGKDLVGKLGYKKSIVFGLLFSALGAVAMIIAVEANTFEGMLIGFFMVALGFSLQQTAAQPFAIALGDPVTGASRVNLGGGVNSFGTTIGPILVALALFGTTKEITAEQIASLSLNKVVILYSVVGALFVIAAAIFYFSKKVPSGIIEEKSEQAAKALILLLIISALLLLCFIPVFNSYKGETISKYTSIDALEMSRMYWLLGALAVVIVGLSFAGIAARKQPNGWGAMRYPQLVLGMIALFIYVGVEVAIGSNLSELLKLESFGGLSTSEATPYVAMYWGSLMIGRWTGAVAAFNVSNTTRTILKFVAPIAAFTVILVVGTLVGYKMSPMYYYISCVLLHAVVAYITKDKPAITLMVFGFLGALFMLFGIFNEGTPAIYAFLAGGLCCSIMWPCIFSLSLAGLGKYTSQGSAFLIMMILGGGVIPPIQGKLSDIIGIHQSFWIPLLCFVFIGLFAVWVKQILMKQGIDYDKVSNA